MKIRCSISIFLYQAGIIISITLWKPVHDQIQHTQVHNPYCEAKIIVLTKKAFPEKESKGQIHNNIKVRGVSIPVVELN